MRRPSPCSMRAMSSWYFKQHADRVGHRLRIERHLVELGQRAGPVDRLGDARHLEQLELAQLLDEAHDLGRKPRVGVGHLAPHDLQLARRVGIVDPVIEAAPLQRVVDLARAVGGDDDDRRLFGLDGAELRHRHLEVGQDLQQERLEGLVGAVELVDQEHGRGARLAGQRFQHRPADQVFFGEDVALHVGAVDVAGRFLHADLDHLRGVVPLVDRRRDVETFIALQPDQPAAERARQHLGDLGLADARLAFEEQRPAHAQAAGTARSPARDRRRSRPPSGAPASRRSCSATARGFNSLILSPEDRSGASQSAVGAVEIDQTG